MKQLVDLGSRGQVHPLQQCSGFCGAGTCRLAVDTGSRACAHGVIVSLVPGPWDTLQCQWLWCLSYWYMWSGHGASFWSMGMHGVWWQVLGSGGRYTWSGHRSGV